MTVHPILSLRGAKRLRPFCHCEPDRFSGQAWQSIFYIIGFASFFLKYEIATPAFGGLAMTMRVSVIVKSVEIKPFPKNIESL